MRISEVAINRLIEGSIYAAMRKFGNKNKGLKTTWSVSEDLVADIEVTNTTVGRYIIDGCIRRFEEEWGKR